MTLVLIPLAAAVGLVVGLRVKHRRFLTIRTLLRDAEKRMDAYRLGDTRTDLDEVGGLRPDRRPVGQYDHATEDDDPELPRALPSGSSWTYRTRL